MEHSHGDPEDHSRKRASVYDAVAGRVGYDGFLTAPQTSKYRDTASTSTTAIPPDEVLFRRQGAPLRYAENDLYNADRNLQPHRSLPESDLLKAVHTYASDYYGSQFLGETQRDFHSLDETALIAMGILLEEAAAHHLGSTGDLALLESSGEHQTTAEGSFWYQRTWRRSVIAEKHAAKRRSPRKEVLDGTQRPSEDPESPATR